MTFKGLVATVAVATALAATAARADVIADFNGGAVGGVTPQEAIWQQYNLTFVATTSITTVGFLIRNDPSYTGLDNISVTLDGGSTNLLANGDLESAPDANSGIAPSGWYVIGTQGLTAAGTWVSGGTPGSTYNSPESGSAYWYDGAVGGHDGIAQDVATTVGATYNLSFWLGGDPVPDGAEVDYQVLAGALPDGVTVLSGNSEVNSAPEPVSAALMGSGLFGMAVAKRKQSQNRRKQH